MQTVPYSNSGFLIFGTYPVVNGVRVYPVNAYPHRIPGSIVQGSNDQASWVDLYTITAQPATGQFTLYTFANTAVYRYIRLLMPDGSYGNVAELEFYQNTALLNPQAVTTFGTPGSYSGSGPFYTAAFDGNVNTSWDAPSSAPCFLGLDFG